MVCQKSIENQRLSALDQRRPKGIFEEAQMKIGETLELIGSSDWLKNNVYQGDLEV